MEQKSKIAKPNWSLVEKIASQVYPNEYYVLTRGDIDEIEEAIDNDIPVDTDEDEGGDMDFPMASIIMTMSLGFCVIQTVIAYMSWRYPHTEPRLVAPKINHQALARDFVGNLLKDAEFEQMYREDIKNELLRCREVINTALEQMYPEELEGFE